MSPYQSIPSRYQHNHEDRSAVIKEINKRRSETRTLKFQARQIIRRHVPTKYLLSLPLDLPASLLKYLTIPELNKL